MKDRVPASGKAGHVLLTPASGGTATEYVLAMADNPSSGNEGTPLNKANLLSDATVSILRTRLDGLRSDDTSFPADPTVNDAFTLLGNTALRYKVGTYTGNIAYVQQYVAYSTSTGIWANANTAWQSATRIYSLNVGFNPLAICIFDPQTTNGATNSPVTVTTANNAGFTYPRQATPKTSDNFTAYGWNTSGGNDDKMPYEGNEGGHWWIRGCPIGLVGCAFSTGYKPRGVPLTWTTTGVQWAGQAWVTNDMWVEGYGTSDAYTHSATHKWLYVNTPLAHSGRTYYYIAIGV